MQNTSLFYDINLCRICQDPEHLDLVYTSTSSENGKTYMDLLKFIFNDILWIEDSLISLACHICIKKISDVAEFKSICSATNSRRDALHKVEHIKLEIQTEVDGGTEIEAIVDGQTAEVDQLLLVKFEEQNSIDDEELQDNDCPRRSKRTKRETVEKQQSRDKNKSESTTISKVKTNNHQVTPIYHCDICFIKAKGADDLDRHMNKHNGSRNYICTECGKAYITKDDLKQHSFWHSTEAIYPCAICNKKYRTPKHLKVHKKIVHSNKEDFKYACSDCGAKFQQQCMVKRHVLLRHTKILSYKCDMCDKGFVDRRSLQNHILTHSNVRTFKCDLCPAEYKRRDTLLHHKTKSHGIGNYKFPVKKNVECTFCSRMIGKDHLARHIRTHTGVKPFSCRLCDTKFNCKSYIKGHLKTKHDMDVEAGDFNSKLYYDEVEETEIEDPDITEDIREKTVAEAAPLSSRMDEANDLS